MKNFIKYSFYATAFALAIFSVSITHAQTLPSCPTGYTCTQLPTQPVGCPVGWTCVPAASVNTGSSNTGYTVSGVGYAGISGGGYYDSNGCFDYTFSNNLSIGSTGA